MAESVTTLAGGERIVGAGDRAVGPDRRRGGRGRDPARADAVQHGRGRVGRRHRDPPEGPLHRVPGRVGRSCASRRAAGRWSPSPRAPSPAVWPRPTTRRPRAGSCPWCARPPPASTATASRPTPSPRWPGPGCRPTCPMDLAEMGDPEDVAPMVVYLLSDRARHVTGQVYTSVGPKIAVWNQPREVRAMYADGRWTPEQIAQRLDSTVGQERMPLLDQLEAYRKAAEEKAAAERRRRLIRRPGRSDRGPSVLGPGRTRRGRRTRCPRGRPAPPRTRCRSDRCRAGWPRATRAARPRARGRRGPGRGGAGSCRPSSSLTRTMSRGCTRSKSGWSSPGSIQMSPSSSTRCSQPSAAHQKAASAHRVDRVDGHRLDAQSHGCLRWSVTARRPSRRAYARTDGRCGSRAPPDPGGPRLDCHPFRGRASLQWDHATGRVAVVVTVPTSGGRHRDRTLRRPGRRRAPAGRPGRRAVAQPRRHPEGPARPRRRRGRPGRRRATTTGRRHRPGPGPVPLTMGPTLAADRDSTSAPDASPGSPRRRRPGRRPGVGRRPHPAGLPVDRVRLVRRVLGVVPPARSTRPAGRDPSGGGDQGPRPRDPRRGRRPGRPRARGASCRARPGPTTRYPARRSSSWSTARPGAGSARAWPTTSARWPSWCAGPRSTPAAFTLDTRSGRDVGLDGPARESANDRELLDAGIRPGDPSLYPTSLEDLYGPPDARMPAAPRHGPPGGLTVPTLFAHGIGAGLPTGFEGRIFKRQGSGIEVANAVAQFATFALPDEVGDFGGGAVNLMGNDDVFAVLFEYGPDSLGTRLFAHQGMPRPLVHVGLPALRAAPGADRPVRHPVVLHRGRPTVHLLRGAGQPCPPLAPRPPGQPAARRGVRPTGPAWRLRRGPRGTDRPLPGRLRAAGRRRDGQGVPADGHGAGGGRRGAAAPRRGARPWSGSAPWPRPSSGTAGLVHPSPATAGLVAALLPGLRRLRGRRPARGGPLATLRLLRDARHPGHPAPRGGRPVPGRVGRGRGRRPSPPAGCPHCSAGQPWHGVPLVLLSLLCAWLAFLALSRLAELGGGPPAARRHPGAGDVSTTLVDRAADVPRSRGCPGGASSTGRPWSAVRWPSAPGSTCC